MSLTNIIQEISIGWQDYYKIKDDKRAPTVDKKHEIYKKFIEEFPNLLRENADKKIFEIEGSTGDGYITRSPWVATYDFSITDNVQEGFYVVYLFSVDMKRLYLTIGFGATQFEDKYKKRDLMLENMKMTTNLFQNLFKKKIKNGLIVGQPNLNSEKGTLQESYENCTAFMYPAYDLSKLPDDKKLIDDYKNILSIYREVSLDSNSEQFETISETNYQVEIDENEEADIIDFKPIKAKKRAESKTKDKAKKKIRSEQSKKIGRAGEEFVYEQEKKKLVNRPELLKKIIKHYDNNEYPGFDITSYDENGNEIYIEVKSTKSASMTSFELTDNEYKSAFKYRDKYFVYIVLNATKEVAKLKNKRSIIKLHNPADKIEKKIINAEPSQYNIDLRKYD